MNGKGTKIKPLPGAAFSMYHLINILGKALLCHCCVQIHYPPSDVRGKICAWGKGQNTAGRTLPKTSKYCWVSANTRACSPAFPALGACNQVEEVPAHGWDWESPWAVLEEEVIFNVSLIDV